MHYQKGDEMIWKYVRTFFSGIIILYLQVLVMPKFAAAGVIPNLFLGWIVYQVLNRDLRYLAPVLLIIGICYDLTIPNMLGLQSMLFILLAIVVEEFHRPLEKESYLTMLITLVLINLIYAALIYLVYGVQAGFSGGLFLSFLVMVFYNFFGSVIVLAVFIFVSHLRLDIAHG